MRWGVRSSSRWGKRRDGITLTCFILAIISSSVSFPHLLFVISSSSTSFLLSSHPFLLAKIAVTQRHNWPSRNMLCVSLSFSRSSSFYFRAERRKRNGRKKKRRSEICFFKLDLKLSSSSSPFVPIFSLVSPSFLSFSFFPSILNFSCSFFLYILWWFKKPNGWKWRREKEQSDLLFPIHKILSGNKKVTLDSFPSYSHLKILHWKEMRDGDETVWKK